MGDVSEAPVEEPTEFEQKLIALRDRTDHAARVALVGSATEPVRRVILFALISLALALGIPVLGFVALILLAYTDRML